MALFSRKKLENLDKSADTSGSEEAFTLRSPPPSIHLKKILANYPEGSQILKEALQNADDAGASIFAVIMDDRRHHRPGCPDLERFLGPSLLLYNDGIFSPTDWESLQNMFESEKAENLASIGKFGMGSRSYFHMTDLLSVVSGNYYAFIDPDHLISTRGGEKIHYVKLIEKWTEDPNMNDKLELLDAHLSLFEGVKGFDKRAPFPATIFRLPLRIGKYARSSNFAPYEYTPGKVKRILSSFQRELVDCLLFLQQVMKVELHHWPEEEEEMKLICDCEALQLNNDGVYIGRLPSPFRSFLQDVKTPQELQEKLGCADSGTLPKLENRLKIQLTVLDESGSVTTKETQDWLVFLQIVSSVELLDVINSAKAAPLIGVAALVSDISQHLTTKFSDEKSGPNSTIKPPMPRENEIFGASRESGKLFNFLPISDAETGLPVHLHANFCLTDNRRDLWLGDYDTEGRAKTWTTWNKLLLFKCLPPLTVSLLSALQSETLLYLNWPDSSTVQPRFRAFLTQFAEAALDVPLFFLADGSRVVPRACKFLRFGKAGATALSEVVASSHLSNRPTQKLKLLHAVTRIALDKGHKVVVAPPWVKNSLEQGGMSEGVRSVSFLTLMYNIVLPHWNSMAPTIFPRMPWFLHWMLILSKTLAQSPVEEIQAFRMLCDELRWVPIERVHLTKQIDRLSMTSDLRHFDKEMSEDEAAFISGRTETCVLSQPTLEAVDPDDNNRFLIVCPRHCYDTGLRGFKVAARSIPYGEFSSPSVLRVLREWGLNSTLTWSDMTQEIVLRLCTHG